LNPTWGPQGQSSFPPQGLNPYPPQGQTGYPPQGKLGYPPQVNQANFPPPSYTSYPPHGKMDFSSPFMHIPQKVNTTFVGQQQKKHMGGHVGYNYPPQPVYDPTSVPIPH
jgi:hypothetical protein